MINKVKMQEKIKYRKIEIPRLSHLPYHFTSGRRCRHRGIAIAFLHLSAGVLTKINRFKQTT